MLFERGWGKVPQAIDIDIKNEVGNILDDLGLSLEEARDDPLLRQLIASAGIEMSETKVEDGTEFFSEVESESEGGPDSDASERGDRSEQPNHEQPGPDSVD